MKKTTGDIVASCYDYIAMVHCEAFKKDQINLIEFLHHYEMKLQTYLATVHDFIVAELYGIIHRNYARHVTRDHRHTQGGEQLPPSLTAGVGTL